ncbi:MAG: hydroxyacid dehydrogenase [Lachnospiraceae bacterium]|nr:hydroxyacid dehydrogenase [Lachnospiraceae bacterium]
MNELVGKKVFYLEPIDGIDVYVDQFKLYRESGCDLSVGPFVSETDKVYSKEELIEIGNTYDAVIGMHREAFTRDIIMQCDKLQMITKTGIGMDHVDIPAATEKGILVTNTPGQNTLTVAEHAITLMLALLKKLPYEERHLREGFWRDNSTLSEEIFHSTIGLVGFGNIGKMVARRLQGWDCNLIAYDPYLTEEQIEGAGLNVKKVDWETLWSVSDVVSVHCPLTAETRGLVGARELSLMKPTAYLINTARGPIVKVKDLNEALRAGKIAGAGIDTHDGPEPVLPDYPLLDLHENVILTPHNAGWAGPGLARLAVVAAQNTIDGLTGKITNACNPEVESFWRSRFFS